MTTILDNYDSTIHKVLKSKIKLCKRKVITSGSPVSWFVWIRIFPNLTSFKTSQRACSIVSPARKIDTPQICQCEL